MSSLVQPEVEEILLVAGPDSVPEIETVYSDVITVPV